MAVSSPSPEILRQLCTSFQLHQVDERRWSIGSPFLYEDGDGLPVFLEERSEGGWTVTDQGMAFSHLFFDDFEYTDARLRTLQRVVDGWGYDIDRDTHRISVDLSDDPSAYQIADFIQVLCEVRGAATAAITEKQSQQYRTQMRRRVKERLRGPGVEEFWAPASLQRTNAFRADLRLETDQEAPVVLFLASTSERATRAALTVDQFRKVGTPMAPLMAYDHHVSSDAVWIFQEYAQGGDESALPVEVDSDAHLARRLANMGVPIAV